MTIKQLVIKNYQPLKDAKHSFHNGFNLVFGPNEHGKSLTIDALVKLLFGKSSKSFKDINRVEADPAQFGSYVNLELTAHRHPNTTTLQGKPNLTDLLGLTADECQNLFIIRNNDLSIGQDITGQDRFFTQLTDKLTGLKTQEILSLKKKLREIAQLTDKTNQFQSSADNLELGKRLAWAQELLNKESKLTLLLEQNKTNQWLELENEALDLRHQLETIQHKLEQLEIAKKHQDLQSLAKQIKQLKQLLLQLETYDQITLEILEEYHSNEQTLENLTATQLELKQEIKSKKETLDQLIQQLETVTSQLTIKNKAKQELDDNIQPELASLVKKIANLKSQRTKPWQNFSIASCIMLGLALLTYLLQPATLLLLLIGSFFLISLFTSGKYIFHTQQYQKLKEEEEKLKLRAAQYGIKSQQLTELLAQVQLFKQETEQLNQQFSSLTARKEQIELDLTQLNEQKLTIVTKKLAQTKQKLTAIKNQGQFTNSAQLQKQLSHKQSLINQQQQLTALITDKLGVDPNKPINLSLLESWQTQIDHKQSLVKKNTQLSFNKDELIKLTAQKTQSENRLTEIKQQLSLLTTQLHDLEKDVNQILKDSSELIVCDNIHDLLQSQLELKKFIKYHQDQRQLTVDLIQILEKIELTEKAKVGELFGEKSIISSHFQSITHRQYDLVSFDQATSQITVRHATNKKIIPASKLSAGTYDQLYFAIRLGLGLKLLNEQPGFFILDDPFLKSDQQRLKQQLDMLFELTLQGWQIIYFSAKEEIKKLVENKANCTITL